jgi:NADH-quinone oxidoreductase subunit A
VAAYLPIATLLVLAAVFAAGSFLASRILAPSRPTAAKEGPYESGIVPSSDPAQRFPVKFYLVSMIFVIFDIEIIFTYPWAVIFARDLGGYGLVEMLLFAVVVIVSFLYLISNGALDWGPSRAPAAPAQERERTTRSTVQRVRKVRRTDGGESPSERDGELVDTATTRG